MAGKTRSAAQKRNDNRFKKARKAVMARKNPPKPFTKAFGAAMKQELAKLKK